MKKTMLVLLAMLLGNTALSPRAASQVSLGNVCISGFASLRSVRGGDDGPPDSRMCNKIKGPALGNR